MPTTRASRSDTRSSCARHAATRPRPPSTTTAAGRGNLDQHGVHFLTAYSLAAEIASPRAFIATVTTRLEINELCGRPGRGASVTWCQWLPEPIITDVAPHPAGHAETADSLSLAMLVVLESLSPEQRCTAVARRVRRRLPGDHGIVGKSGDNVRQLATRAPQQVKAHLPRFSTREQQHKLARLFFAAAEHGDLAELESLLAHDVELPETAVARLRRWPSRFS